MVEDLSDARTTSILEALNRGVRPRLTPSSKYVLQLTNKRYIDLVLADGHTTPEGNFVYQYLGQEIPNDHQIDQGQTPYTRKGVQYLKDRTGREVKYRVLMADGKTWKVTQAGVVWDRIPHAQVIVKIPVIYEGVNNNGQEYEREEWYMVTEKEMPNLDEIVLDKNRSEEQKHQAIIALIKDKKRITGERTVVGLTPSGETIVYDQDRDGQWKISMMITRPGEQGPSVQTILDRPLAAASSVPISTSDIPYVNQVIPESMERHDDHLCVPRGMAALLKRELEDVCLSFDYLKGSSKWRTVGLSANDIEAWCVDNLYPFFVVLRHGGRIVKRSVVSERVEKGHRSIAFTIVENHAYFYKDAHVVARLIDEENLDQPLPSSNDRCMEPIIQPEFEANNSPEVKDWLPWDYNIRPGHFYAVGDDLQLERGKLLRMGRSCRVWVSSSKKKAEFYSKLSITCCEQLDKAKGECVIRILPEEHAQIQTWLDNIELMTGEHIKWQGQGLPNLTLMVFEKLIRTKHRGKLSKEQKQEIALSQKNLCAECGDAAIDEYDHCPSLKATYRRQTQKFRGLCAACHASCTRLESDKAVIKSVLSPHACSVYRDSERPSNLHYISQEKLVERKGLHCIDLKRCRQSAMLHYDLPDFPCFCPLDNIIQRTDYSLGDLNYVEMKEGDSGKLKIDELPLYGTGWYPELVVRHALNHQLIKWDNITYTYRATGRIPREDVEVTLTIMEQAWGDNEALAKASWNDCVGCMSKEFSTLTKIETVIDKKYVWGNFAEFHFTQDDGTEGVIYDMITRIPTVSSSTYRPLQDAIFGWEHVKVSTLVHAIQKYAQIPRRHILEIQTDACLVVSGATKRKIDAICDLTYEDAGRMSNRPLFNTIEYPVRIGDHGKIYQQKLGKQCPYRRYEKVRRNGSKFARERQWKYVSLRKDGVFDASSMYAHVLAGSHLWLEGMGGCGKTTFSRVIVELLRNAGKTVQVIAKTYPALQNFGEGMTADRWLNAHVLRGRGKLPDVLLVEEISLLGLNLWGMIATAFMAGKLKKMQIILAGDLFQLDPPKNQWCGNPVKKHALKNSDLLYDLAQGYRCFFDQNLRSDEVIFEFAKGLRREEADLAECLQKARELFPVTDRVPDTILVISHQKRMSFNAQINERLRTGHKDAVYLELTQKRTNDECKPQAMWCWKGMHVVGQQKPCMRSQMYEVISVEQSQEITLQSLHSVRANGERPEGSILKVKKNIATDAFRMAHAITYCRSQGLTMSGVVCLADVNSPHFTLEHLNLGITRATHSSLVEIREC